MAWRFAVMMRFSAWLLAWGVLTGVAQGVEYRVEALAEKPPADEVAPEIAAQLAPTGIRVIRGASTTYCDIWLLKELKATLGFKPTTEVLYPFQVGQLIGVAKYARKGADFRDQDIETGTYTLRYAQQPVDGAHVGTSPTRDFLLLSAAEKDRSLAPLEYKPLTKQSAEAAGSSHPALLAMQRVATKANEFPAIRHNEERDWWIVALQAPLAEGKPLVCELVVVGVATE
jgi:hypothetical protein